MCLTYCIRKETRAKSGPSFIPPGSRVKSEPIASCQDSVDFLVSELCNDATGIIVMTWMIHQLLHGQLKEVERLHTGWLPHDRMHAEQPEMFTKTGAPWTSLASTLFTVQRQRLTLVRTLTHHKPCFVVKTIPCAIVSRLSRPQAVSSLLIDRFSSARAPEADATDR